jgi:hypothetical protein
MEMRLATFLFVLWIGWLASDPAMATNRYVVGVEQLTAPIGADDSVDSYQPYFRDVLNAFAESKGIKFDFKSYPSARLLISLLDGEIDFKCPDNPGWASAEKRERKFIYSNSLVNAVEGAMVKKENAAKGVSGFKTLGVPLGFTPVALDALIKDGKVTVERNASISGLLVQVLMGRIDGVYYNSDSATNIMKKEGKGDQIALNLNLPHVRMSYHVSTIRQGKLMSDLNKFLDENTALISKLQQKYGLRRH